eukprot:203715-Rhodomonas_salina.1
MCIRDSATSALRDARYRRTEGCARRRAVLTWVNALLGTVCAVPVQCVVLSGVVLSQVGDVHHRVQQAALSL